MKRNYQLRNKETQAAECWNSQTLMRNPGRLKSVQSRRWMNHQTVAVLLVGYLWGRSSPVTGFHRQSTEGRCRKERETNIGSDIGLN